MAHCHTLRLAKAQGAARWVHSRYALEVVAEQGPPLLSEILLVGIQLVGTSRHTLLASLEAHHSSFAVPVGVGSLDLESAPGNLFVIADHHGTFPAPDGIEAQQALNMNVADPHGPALGEAMVMAGVDLTQFAVELVTDGDCSAAAVVKGQVEHMDPRTAPALGE